jgi:hypothetical protein
MRSLANRRERITCSEGVRDKFQEKLSVVERDEDKEEIRNLYFSVKKATVLK